MAEAETPTPTQEHTTVKSSHEASTSDNHSLHYPNTPFTLVHVWEDHYTRENTSNLTDTQPCEAPDNVVAIPSYFFEEFFLASHGCAPVVHSVASTAIAEEPSSNAPNTPLEESPNVSFQSPTLEHFMKEAAARRNSTSTSPLYVLENDVVVETSGSAQSTFMDSMSAVASPALLRERESEKTAVQILEDILAES